MTAAVRRLARCIYTDTLVCVCGESLPVRIMAAVSPGDRKADAYSTALECPRCKAAWAVVLQTRSYPHLRIQRIDRGSP